MTMFDKTFEIKGLLLANAPTESGNVYTMECLKMVEDQIMKSPNRITIQEMNVPERERDGIPMHEPIKSRTMAIIVGAKIIGNSLDVACETKTSRDGKKLIGIFNTVGLPNINFIPVGMGNTRKEGKFNILTDYLLKYVAIEPMSI